ncbi:TPA: winged-helix domain-containing protein [Enterococcus faecalis]|nr:winged-helix domain-containing protein [Enterococcus faecalis]
MEKYTIGVVPLTIETKEYCQNWFVSNQVECQIIQGTNILLHLHHIDGLVIEVTDHQQVNTCCELLMTIRKQSDLPIWLFSRTEAISKVNRIIYLQLGADGVFDHSYDRQECVLSMSNLLQRVKRRFYPNLSVCLGNGEEILLTKLEFFTIEYLYKHAGQTITYEELYKNVWKDTANERKYRVANVIFHLRKKIEQDVNKPQYIKTIRSKGYMLTV